MKREGDRMKEALANKTKHKFNWIKLNQIKSGRQTRIEEKFHFKSANGFEFKSYYETKPNVE